MLDTIRKSAMTIAALGPLGFGGAQIAGAADTSSSSGSRPLPGSELVAVAPRAPAA